MAEVNGILGVVNGKSSIRNWSVSTKADLSQFVASNTKGMTGVVEGIKDWSGKYSAYGHTPDDMPGDEISFSGSIDGANGASGSAIIDSVEIEIDIEGGGVISNSVNFSGNGALTLGGAAAHTDVATPDIFPSVGRKIELAVPAGSPSYTELTNVRTVRIRLASSNVAYSDSSTAGIKKRKKGNLSAGLSISVHAGGATLANIATLINSLQFAKVYVTSTTYWEFKAVRFNSVSDILIDRENASMVAASLDSIFTSHYLVSSTLTEGTIIKPSTIAWWPTP